MGSGRAGRQYSATSVEASYCALQVHNASQVSNTSGAAVPGEDKSYISNQEALDHQNKLQCTSATSVISQLAVSKLSTSTSTLLSMFSNMTTAIERFVARNLLSSTLTPPVQFQNAIIPLELGSLGSGTDNRR